MLNFEQPNNAIGSRVGERATTVLVRNCTERVLDCYVLCHIRGKQNKIQKAIRIIIIKPLLFSCSIPQKHLRHYKIIVTLLGCGQSAMLHYPVRILYIAVMELSRSSQMLLHQMLMMIPINNTTKCISFTYISDSHPSNP